ncbi:MAG: flagellar export protein FliJ [Hyphomicrobiaceae bacterium]
MKARDAALRLKRFELDAKVRKTEDLEQMIREFEGMASDLERQVQVEEERTGIRDRNHFAYSTFARSALQRRANLEASIGDLREKLAAAVAERDAALAEFEDADAILQASERRGRTSQKPSQLAPR